MLPVQHQYPLLSYVRIKKLTQRRQDEKLDKLNSVIPDLPSPALEV